MMPSLHPNPPATKTARPMMSPSLAGSGSSTGIQVGTRTPRPQQHQHHHQQQPVMVTPTSTPPIRVSHTTRREGGLSPSPITEENQKRYYEDSTWRMYDRIQSSRPINSNSINLKQSIMIPPVPTLSSSSSSLMTTFGQRSSSMVAAPRYSHIIYQQRRAMMDEDAMIAGGDDNNNNPHHYHHKQGSGLFVTPNTATYSRSGAAATGAHGPSSGSADYDDELIFDLEL